MHRPSWGRCKDLNPPPTPASRLHLPLVNLSSVTSHTLCFHGPGSPECPHLLSPVCGRGAGGEWRRELLPVFQKGKLRPTAGSGPTQLRQQGSSPSHSLQPPHFSWSLIRAQSPLPFLLPSSPQVHPPQGQPRRTVMDLGQPSFSSSSLASGRALPPFPLLLLQTDDRRECL